MKKCLLRIYDFFASHRRGLWIGFSAVLLLLVGLAISLRFHEDIMDFLPVEDSDRESLTVYQTLQNASRIVLIVESEAHGGQAETMQMENAIDACAERLPDLVTEADLDAYLEHLQFVYSQIPYFLTESTLGHLDSLFSTPAIRSALQRDKTILATPGTGFLSAVIQSDPLGLVPLGPGNSPFTSVDGYMMTADRRMAFAFYDSPYGSTETQRNAALVDSLNAVTDELAECFPDLKIRWIGAPVVSVGNARRIKTDTLLCIALSLVLIIALLAYAFPRRRDLLLIMLSVSFGWLTGMAALRVATPVVSAVVLGIGSVLIGIAVNYPLHLLVHQRYTTSVRQTLDEVLSPLVIGNITTVGAFMALVPLHATVLKHLGIFAAAMLIGTIGFCIFVLPHLMSDEKTPIREIKLNTERWKNNRNGLKVFGQWAVVGLTVVAGIYLMASGKWSDGKWFDSNLSHINYMTAEQRADFACFDSIGRLVSAEDNRKYLAPEARTELQHRAEQWQNYWSSHNADSVVACIRREAVDVGFRPDVFEPFYAVLTDWQPIEQIDTQMLGELWPGKFDAAGLNAHLTQGLSDNFDYIGLCCSAIVFLFLCLSFRNIWLAFIAFMPMALSWVWILAMMQLLGMQFNIVNVILATFIFGQGDDYTIFIVEGLLYERRTGKTILPQFRQSILLSALIMLIGIGILVFAVHPAMHSLGSITLIGMSVVLLMALTIPHLLFLLIPEKWLKV